MEFLKNIIKFVGSLLSGVLIGFAIAALITGTPFNELLSKIGSLCKGELITVVGVSVLSMIVSIFLLVIIHELGHLVCGLISGYKFVSFRVFNLTFINEQGKIRIKKFSIAGIAGQCLLTPPDLPLDKIPTSLYNAGGVLANLLVLAIVLPLMWLNISPLLKTALWIFIVIDAIMILMNAIPMKIGGVSNDGYNIFLLRKKSESKKGMILQLKANALIQNGVRPKDMPGEWFIVENDIDFGNPLELSVPLMKASRLMDMMEWEEAYSIYDRIYENKAKIMGLLVKEIECELIFTSLVTGRMDRVDKIYTKELEKYILAYRKTMSSKERLLCALCLLKDYDREKASGIRNGLEAQRNKYLLQGEVKSDIAVIDEMFRRFGS